MRPIEHPTDFSAPSRPAFAAAIEMAKATHSALVLMHVLNPSMPPVMGDEYISPPRTRDFAKSRGRGRSGVKRVAFGSVAARVLSRAPYPVLTVRGR